jgi:hypothetical protein
MSDYKVIGAVNETLKSLLWSRFKNDSGILSLLSSEDQISLEPPFKLVNDRNEVDRSYLSIYLYRIVENGDMKNRPLELRDESLVNYPPLSLNLFYLVTPLTNSADNDHRLLAKTMQILYDNSILKETALQGILANTKEELRVILNPISLEDITRIWSGFMRPYQLSVSYEVKVIYIDSERQKEAESIRRKRLKFAQI